MERRQSKHRVIIAGKELETIQTEYLCGYCKKWSDCILWDLSIADGIVTYTCPKCKTESKE